MRREALKHFLYLVGSNQIRDQGEWISAECPLARWTHPKKTDRHPSFGVRINNSGQSVYKCYTCKQKAQPIESLLFVLSRYRGTYYREATDFLIKHEVFEEDKQITYDDKWEKEPPKKQTPLPLSVIDKYLPISESPQKIKDFLYKRGTTPQICDFFHVRWSEGYQSLVFPSIWNDGILSVKARRLDQKKFFFLKGGLYLFGIDRIDWFKPVWLVEGEFDLLRLNALGEFNVISLGGSNIPDKLDKYIHAHTLISGFDTDAAGKEATKKLKAMYSKYYNLRFADWGLCGCKDAGDIKSREQLLTIQKNIKTI